MTSTLYTAGRLGNQIIRNLAVSLIAEKFDLYVIYSHYELIKKLGIVLFIGKNNYNNTQTLNDTNYVDTLKSYSLNCNLNIDGFFQTNQICNLLYDYLHSEEIKTNIINHNIFKERYNNNNDLFIHIRLTDAERFNPGLEYYLKAISTIVFDNLYICTDDKNNNIVKQITEKYGNSSILDYDEITTFQFGSTCKNVILSHGSFSAIIGYLSFFSNINYPEYIPDKIWHGDMFSINGWNKVFIPVTKNCLAL